MNTIHLADGRDLAYAEYGDLQGKAVFFFHGIPGSRLFRPPDDISYRMGVRVITVDRPGYGGSTYQHGRVLSDLPEDVRILADYLGVEDFFVAGHSGGGPYALACARALANRVIGATTLSGAGPVDIPGATTGLTTVNRLGFRYAHYLPWSATRLIIRLVYSSRARDPEKAMAADDGKRPTADETLMKNKELRKMCLETEIEAFRQGLKGMARDVYLITRQWDFKLEDIRVPVHIWHGTEDNLTTLVMARSMAAKIPIASITLLSGKGHLLLLDHWEEILTKLFSTKSKITTEVKD